jgi:CRP/FNR family transcriptional regulator, cyclic AMP receptor protein
MMEPEAVAGVLRTVPLFKSFRPSDLQRLARMASVRSYKEGKLIVRQDDTAVTFYCVLSGGVRIEREGSAEGPVLLAEFGPGGFFGEMSLVDDAPRSASVTATAPTVCALISRWDFQRELKARPDVALALLRTLSQRVRELDARLAV